MHRNYTAASRGFHRPGAPSRPPVNLIPSPPAGSDFLGPLARWLAQHRITPDAAELPADGLLRFVDSLDGAPGNRAAAVVLTTRNGWPTCLACCPADAEPLFWFGWRGMPGVDPQTFTGCAMAAQSAMLRARRVGARHG